MSRRCSSCGRELVESAQMDMCADCEAKTAVSATIKVTVSEALLDKDTAAIAGGPPQAFGDYELIEEIARGGMGVVYKARERSLNRIVALKMIRSDYVDPDSGQRFYTEAQAAARLQHPNIIAVHAVGQFGGQHFYSMDYVQGRSLAQLARTHPLSASQAATYVKKIAEAIHYAHQSGILHRDLKPSNVLIDGHDEPRVADFGLAKLMESDSELTLSGAVMGSPSYMPPEQARGSSRDVSVRSDIYSLGAILYDVVCGRPPFRADTTIETLRQVVEMQPVPPGLLNPKAPRDLETICLKCLEKSPAARYASAQELAHELGRFIRGEPILARPVSAPEQFWRWCKRKPAVATALGLLIVVAVASPIVTVVINHARAEAEHNRAVAEANLFVADMNLAMDAVRAENRARALTLLRRHIPKKGEPDRRAFEWRYIWQQARGDYAYKLGAHPDTVRQVLFSPNGNVIVSRSTNGIMKVWDVTNRRERFSRSDVQSLGGFSTDGKSLAVGTTDGDVQLVEIETGRSTTILTNAGALVRWLPEHRAAITTGTNYLAKFWNAVDRREMRTIPGIGGAGDPTRGQQWGPGIAVNSAGTVLASIDKSDGRSQRRVLQILDVATGRILARSPPAENAIAFAEISPDGDCVAWGVEGVIHIWKWRTDAAPLQVPAHASAVRTVTFSPDGTLIATGASDQFIEIWEAATGKRLETRRGHENSIRALSFSPDGKWLVSGGLNETIRVWEISQRSQADIVELGGTQTRDSSVYQRELIFSPDSQRIATWIAPNSAAVLDCNTLETITVASNVQRVLRFGESKDRLLTVGKRPETTLLEWNLTANEFTPAWQRAPIDSVQLESAAVRGNAIAVPDGKGAIHLQSLTSQHALGSAALGEDTIEYLAYAPEAQSVAALIGDRQILVWDAPSGNLATRFTNHTEKVHHIAYSPDGRWLASGGRDKTVRLWSLKQKREAALLEGHRHAVYAVAFSPDGKLLASGSLDNTVKLWNLQLAQEVARLDLSNTGEVLPEKGVMAVAFSPDGSTLACRTRNGTLKLWRAASWEKIRAEERE